MQERREEGGGKIQNEEHEQLCMRLLESQQSQKQIRSEKTWILTM
jgi:hypothetical protein